MIFLTLLGVDATYFIKSEDTHTGDWASAHVIHELKTSHLYNKLDYQYIMLKRKIQLKDITKFQWLIELKYIKENEKNTLEKVKEQGLKQLEMYSESKMVKEELDGENLKKVLIVVVGKRAINIY
ncbi:PD-(D/E)XK nuclease domain-containing protein [Clostridium guangxiense]|nr:PD-(D/E)XK nuclease domain-containing protein [Clostridium guangxiense]MCD2346263.1 PD-(D/E)XK nuclease domain-containing protein [Clostridium guangxiense]